MEGGQGSNAEKLGGKTEVVLPAGAGLAELKKAARRIFGKYPHHAMTPVKLVGADSRGLHSFTSELNLSNSRTHS
jgi:hypothetical protein